MYLARCLKHERVLPLYQIDCIHLRWFWYKIYFPVDKLVQESSTGNTYVNAKLRLRLGAGREDLNIVWGHQLIVAIVKKCAHCILFVHRPKLVSLLYFGLLQGYLKQALPLANK